MTDHAEPIHIDTRASYQRESDHELGDQLRARARYYQGVMRLEDWTIELRVLRSYDMPASGIAGEARPLLEKQLAIISILDPRDYDPACMPDRINVAGNYDPEITLIHELAHLYTAPFEPEHGTLEHKALEFAVHRISAAIYTLEHRDRRINDL